jgi:RHS repeat-associated protein
MIEVWDGQKILLETNASNVTQVIYTLSPGVYGDLISQRRSGATSYYVFDPLGSASRLTDGNENVTDSYLFKAFGEALLTGQATTNPFQFVGRAQYQLDVNLSAYAIRRRRLVPAIGRWLSIDPAFPLLRERNQYVYCSNGPIMCMDPSGLQGYNWGPFEIKGQRFQWDCFGPNCVWRRPGTCGILEYKVVLNPPDLQPGEVTVAGALPDTKACRDECKSFITGKVAPVLQMKYKKAVNGALALLCQDITNRTCCLDSYPEYAVEPITTPTQLELGTTATVNFVEIICACTFDVTLNRSGYYVVRNWVGECIDLMMVGGLNRGCPLQCCT